MADTAICLILNLYCRYSCVQRATEWRRWQTLRYVSFSTCIVGIAVCNVPGYGVEEVADTAICLILNLYCRYSCVQRATEWRRWQTLRYVSFSTCIVGIAVCNVPGYGVEEVADTAICLILNLYCRYSCVQCAWLRCGGGGRHYDMSHSQPVSSHLLACGDGS